MGVAEVLAMSNYGTAMAGGSSVKRGESEISFAEILSGQTKTCPYSSLAKDGLIEYNGVVFVCDYKSNSICLGDMTNPQDVLNIELPSGGCLKVNVNNFDDLSMAAGMFSPADLNAIMRAIAQYNHYSSKLREMEDEENLTDVIKQYRESHEMQALELKDPDDWRKMSDEEWDKLMKDVDQYIDAFKEHLKQVKELQDEAVKKAALEADPQMRSIAMSQAALAVASGFASDTQGDEPDFAEDVPEREEKK